MARWEPDAPQRLAAAALDLFAERGYDGTTVMDIAQRAGLAKSSFFRHFRDKRGVLFGEDLVAEPLTAGIAEADADAAPLAAVAHGIEALGQHVFTADHQAFSARRRAVIEAHDELREREALKGVSLTDSMARALVHRGTPRVTARVAAELGALVLKVTYERWSESGNTREFGGLAREALGEVRAGIGAAQGDR